ncbi:MAG TPA: HAD hydrolase family protein [Acidobacteriota bacterium]|nr:HAD hydrolase family protein [Acidobacteriota bacterium]
MTTLTREQFIERLKTIRLLAIDVDGTLTDDSIFFGPDGFEMKKFNVSDGFFMVLAMRQGLELAVVSGRNSPATETRMKDLGIQHVLQGRRDKCDMIEPLLSELGITYSQVAFVGNELLDIKLAQKVGLPLAVADANDELKTVVSYVTARKGGEGAVREILECYFEAIGVDPKSLVI